MTLPATALRPLTRPDEPLWATTFCVLDLETTGTGALDALRDATPLHRCSDPARCRGCALPGHAPCSDPGAVRRIATALAGVPGALLDALRARPARLAAAGRFEEAAEARERAALLERTLVRQAQARALAEAGEVVVAAGGRVLVLSSGSAALPGPAETAEARVLHAAAARGACCRAAARGP